MVACFGVFPAIVFVMLRPGVIDQRRPMVGRVHHGALRSRRQNARGDDLGAMTALEGGVRHATILAACGPIAARFKYRSRSVRHRSRKLRQVVAPGACHVASFRPKRRRRRNRPAGPRRCNLARLWRGLAWPDSVATARCHPGMVGGLLAARCAIPRASREMRAGISGWTHVRTPQRTVEPSRGHPGPRAEQRVCNSGSPSAKSDVADCGMILRQAAVPLRFATIRRSSSRITRR